MIKNIKRASYCSQRGQFDDFPLTTYLLYYPISITSLLLNCFRDARPKSTKYPTYEVREQVSNYQATILYFSSKQTEFFRVCMFSFRTFAQKTSRHFCQKFCSPGSIVSYGKDTGNRWNTMIYGI